MALRAFALVAISCITSFVIATQCDAEQKSATAWMDEAIIYGIAPTFISEKDGQKLNDIRAHLPEIKKLGANTIWLMPVYESNEGEEGYDVTDYFKLLPELGTEQDLAALIHKAHALNLKVMFDFVPNHLAAQHPYVQDVTQKGAVSPYHEMFMTKMDSAPYSKFYQWSKYGSVNFVVYFWKELINLNFDSEIARRHIREAALYWVKKFSIDGYRFDAAWGPVARNAQFMIDLRDELKRVKPSFMILAEDKAGQPAHYENTDLPFSAQIFDVVYDWTASADYVSEWSWSQDEHSIFKLTAEEAVADRFRKAIQRNGDPKKLNARILRFLENNDGERFISSHSLEETKLAAALTFTLPGIPLIFYGQEIGFGATEVEQGIQYPAFDPQQSMQSRDSKQLWPYYQKLAQIRSANPELTRGKFSELVVYPAPARNQVYAFQRVHGNDKFVIVANLDESPVTYSIPGQVVPARLKGNEIIFYKNGSRLNFTR